MLVQPLVLKLAAIDLADAGSVEVFAGEVGELVRERTRSGASVTVACEGELAELVKLHAFSFLPLRLLLTFACCKLLLLSLCGLLELSLVLLALQLIIASLLLHYF